MTPFKPTRVVDHDICDWKGNSSLGHASFRPQKLMQTRIFPFFFVTGTILATQSGCSSSLIKPEPISFLTSDWIAFIIFGRNYRCCCLTGFASGLMLRRCIATLIELFLLGLGGLFKAPGQLFRSVCHIHEGFFFYRRV